MDPISKAFVAALGEFARREKIPVIQFRKGQRKDDIAAAQRKKFKKSEGVVFIGKQLAEGFHRSSVGIGVGTPNNPTGPMEIQMPSTVLQKLKADR